MNEPNHDSFRVLDASAPNPADGLRSIAWGELTARLTAQRELARLMRKQGERRPASFGRLVSLANHICEQRVNQCALGNGKPHSGKDAPAARQSRATEDRND